MNFLLNPGAGFDGERVLKGLDFAALLYRIGGSGRLRGLRYLLRLRLVRHLCRLRCFRYLHRSRHPGKTAALKKKRLYRISGTVACSYSYFFGVTVPRMLKTILSGVPLVDTVIDLAMPPMRLVS